jgi:hypothetical protein
MAYEAMFATLIATCSPPRPCPRADLVARSLLLLLLVVVVISLL